MEPNHTTNKNKKRQSNSINISVIFKVVAKISDKEKKYIRYFKFINFFQIYFNHFNTRMVRKKLRHKGLLGIPNNRMKVTEKTLLGRKIPGIKETEDAD